MNFGWYGWLHAQHRNIVRINSHSTVLRLVLRTHPSFQGWWDSLDFLDEDRMAEKRAREAEEAAAVMKDPALELPEGEEEEEEEGEMDDIFTDFMKEQEAEVSLASPFFVGRCALSLSLAMPFGRWVCFPQVFF